MDGWMHGFLNFSFVSCLFFGGTCVLVCQEEKEAGGDGDSGGL